MGFVQVRFGPYILARSVIYNGTSGRLLRLKVLFFSVVRVIYNGGECAHFDAGTRGSILGHFLLICAIVLGFGVVVATTRGVTIPRYHHLYPLVVSNGRVLQCFAHGTNKGTGRPLIVFFGGVTVSSQFVVVSFHMEGKGGLCWVFVTSFIFTRRCGIIVLFVRDLFLVGSYS